MTNAWPAPDPCMADCPHIVGVRPGSGPAFNDPETWGFCRYCAFLVQTMPSGRLKHHDRTRDLTTTNSFHPVYKPVRCDGGGRMQHKQPGPEAKPLSVGTWVPPITAPLGARNGV